jgi:hypothetical protein
LNLIRHYLDRKAEAAAQRLLAADEPIITAWRMCVWENIKSRRGRWADVAYLKRLRTRKYA